MKPTIYRRVRRRPAPTRSEGAFFKKESQESFFGGGSEHESFFKSTTTHGAADTVQRKCEKCEEEEKQVKRQPEKKEEEKKVMRVEEKKEEEKKVMRVEEKKEEEKKVMKKEDKKEEEKIQRAPEKKEEEKVMKKEEKKEEEKIQREPEKKEDEKLQKKEATSSGGGSKSVSNYISSLNGKGEALSSSANHFFSARMGYDFSDVRVHNDKEAADSAKAVNAKAYAVGKNIVFNEAQYNTGSSEGQRLMAHELTHVVQQDNNAVNKKVQRQVVPPPAPAPAPAAPVPHFRDCVETVTGIDTAVGDASLFAALNRAREFATTAIAVLDNPPVPGTPYETALATHFGTPISDRRRRRLQTIYRRMLGSLVPRNFMCNRLGVRGICADLDPQAYWSSSDDLVHLCPRFWVLVLNGNVTCQAIVMLHEVAHDAGIDTDGIEETHTPIRGDRTYPVQGDPPVGVRRSRRLNSPDAFGFFAAHVHNGADTPGDCQNG